MITNATLNGTLADVKTYLSGILTYGAVGSSSTTPLISDVQLGAEFFRKARAMIDTTSVSNAITVSLQIGAAEANGNTIRETGWFNTSGATSGTAFIHNLVNAITKTSDIQVYLDQTVSIVVVEI